jgi:hypothetical protein
MAQSAHSHQIAMPVDVETQCGVLLASGNQCAKGLDCKAHGMAKKRAVTGRSAPFDILLNQTRTPISESSVQGIGEQE